ncbi:hypothetical protein [Moorena sp. SIO4G3]|uniref:hypothetical protein n=1 Tax=Moorena sp. SIO4G3 TaxID=2607821 RepID=UPI00142B3B08|nr:hypothetical protein [Moorena sp. SIO4G3]NEO82321.1 hypothetical protein [Moorena sp. SIO4G3]
MGVRHRLEACATILDTKLWSKVQLSLPPISPSPHLPISPSPCSLFPVPYSLLPTPYSLFPSN